MTFFPLYEYEAPWYHVIQFYVLMTFESFESTILLKNSAAWFTVSVLLNVFLNHIQWQQGADSLIRFACDTFRHPLCF